MNSETGFWNRLRRRLKHGLLTQEVLDRLANAGFVCYPYYLVRELPLQRPDVDALGKDLDARFLAVEELDLVSNISERPRQLDRIRLRLDHGGCFGVWVDGEFAAYSWYSDRRVPSAIGAQSLCSLPENTVYLYDAFVRPQFRGHKIAGFMRHKLHEALASKGVSECVSISLTFNRSTRRFKARLGAEETELRLLLSIGSIGGYDFRLRQTSEFLPTPRTLRMRHSTEQRA